MRICSPDLNSVFKVKDVMTHLDHSPSDSARTIQSSRHPIRWWPCILILLAEVIGLVWIWSFSDISRQEQNIRTTVTSAVIFGLLLVWLLFFSRARWRVRFEVFGAIVGALLLAGALVRIRGVTGDLLPVLEWRWQPAKKASLPLNQPVVPEGPSPTLADNTRQTGADYPQFLGPQRNATVNGLILARDWKAEPPKQLWQQPIGAAWSGFSIVGNQAITQEQRGERELVVCYDLLSGRLLWSHEDDARYHTTIAGEGPRATPTIAGNRVYTLGATGLLNCLALETGQPVWSKDIIRDNQARTNDWGMSGSPLIVDDLVIVNPGGPANRSLVAYDKENGHFVWGGGNDAAGYSSPCLVTLADVPQIVIFNASAIAAHDPKSGKVLWEYPWPKGHPHVAVPIVLPNDRLLVSSAYGTGSELIHVVKDSEGKFTASRVWKSIRLKAKFANVVFRDGYLYGLDDGTMVCLDATDGTLKWKEGRYGHGQVILVSDLLVVMAESGDVVLLEPLPQENRELTRFPALRGKTWNPPALAGQYLIVRNDQQAACYMLPTAKK